MWNIFMAFINNVEQNILNLVSVKFLTATFFEVDIL